MFVQVIEGRTSEPDKLRQRLDAWQKDVMPAAIGFLGSTGGIAEDGRFFTIARFESAAQAARNAARPEQDAWWRDTESLFDGPVSFRESEDVETVLSGGSDTAGFVQVIQGRARDRAKVVQAEQQVSDRMSELRPDLIGTIRAWYDGGEFTEVAYFTSEAEARKGEAAEMPADLAEGFADWQSSIGDLRYLDLRDPWLISS